MSSSSVVPYHGKRGVVLDLDAALRDVGYVNPAEPLSSEQHTAPILAFLGRWVHHLLSGKSSLLRIVSRIFDVPPWRHRRIAEFLGAVVKQSFCPSEESPAIPSDRWLLALSTRAVPPERARPVHVKWYHVAKEVSAKVLVFDDHPVDELHVLDDLQLDPPSLPGISVPTFSQIDNFGRWSAGPYFLERLEISCGAIAYQCATNVGLFIETRFDAREVIISGSIPPGHSHEGHCFILPLPRAPFSLTFECDSSIVLFDAVGEYESWPPRTRIIPSSTVVAPSTMRINLNGLYRPGMRGGGYQSHITHFENEIPSALGACLPVRALPKTTEVLRCPVLPSTLPYLGDGLSKALDALVSLDLSAARIFDHKYRASHIKSFAQHVGSDSLKRLVIPVAVPALEEHVILFNSLEHIVHNCHRLESLGLVGGLLSSPRRIPPYAASAAAAAYGASDSLVEVFFDTPATSGVISVSREVAGHFRAYLAAEKERSGIVAEIQKGLRAVSDFCQQACHLSASATEDAVQEMHEATKSAKTTLEAAYEHSAKLARTNANLVDTMTLARAGYHPFELVYDVPPPRLEVIDLELDD
eukprot:tig00000282_g23833.t1